MSIQRPNSSEIVSSLKTLGFNITLEKDNHTTLTKGERTVRVPHGSIDDENERRLRSELEPIFSEHEKTEREDSGRRESSEQGETRERSEDSRSEALDRVRDWLREPKR